MSLDERRVVARIERLTLARTAPLGPRRLGSTGSKRARPGFRRVDVARLRLLCDLRKDVELPADVIPTVLALIDQLAPHQAHLRRLAEALDGSAAEVRTRSLPLYVTRPKARARG